MDYSFPGRKKKMKKKVQNLQVSRVRRTRERGL